MVKRCAEELPSSHGPPSAQKPRIAPNSGLVEKVWSLAVLCGRQDGAAAGHFILQGVTLPIWEPADVLKYMTPSRMQGAISDMEKHLRT
jgi:hypothetical protein